MIKREICLNNMNKFIKQLAGIACIAILLAIPLSVEAQGLNTRATAASVAATKKAELAADRVTKLQTKGLAEIDRRLVVLNGLLPKISGMTMISTESKNSLISEVTQAIADLTTLKSQVVNATDLALLRTEVKSITTGYRAFGFIYPRMHLLLMADKQLARIGSLMELVGKAQAQLAGADSTNVNVGAMIKTLDSAQTTLVQLKVKTNKVVTDLVALKLAGYPSNRSTLMSARQTLNSNNSEMAKMIGAIKGNLGVFREMVGKEGSESAAMR